MFGTNARWQARCPPPMVLRTHRDGLVVREYNMFLHSDFLTLAEHAKKERGYVFVLRLVRDPVRLSHIRDSDLSDALSECLFKESLRLNIGDVS